MNLALGADLEARQKFRLYDRGFGAEHRIVDLRTLTTAGGGAIEHQGAVLNFMGGEVYPPSLAHAVSYVYKMTGVPIIVTEYGVGTDDDRIRVELIPAALADLKTVIDQGVPVKGDMHWSLMDNYERISGLKG